MANKVNGKIEAVYFPVGLQHNGEKVTAEEFVLDKSYRQSLVDFNDEMIEKEKDPILKEILIKLRNLKRVDKI